MSTTGTTLGKSVTQTISSYWGNIVEHLPQPGPAWRWSECDLEPRVQHRLKNNGLIVRSPGGRWETTERLWMHVIERAGDDEPVGCRIGQATLPGSSQATREARELADPGLSNGVTRTQLSLTRDAADVDINRTGVARNTAQGHRQNDGSGVVNGQDTLQRSLIDAGERAAEWTCTKTHASTKLRVA